MSVILNDVGTSGNDPYYAPDHEMTAPYARLDILNYDGLGGEDTVYVPAAMANFTITTSAAGVITVSSASITANFTNVEHLMFWTGTDYTEYSGGGGGGGGNANTPTSGNDSLTGTTGADTIDALAGNDSIDGLAGNDRLTGGEGNDTLLGGEGNDNLTGGAGLDVMLGGAGNDIYYVDNAGDQVFETTTQGSAIDAGGSDSVISTVAFTLGNFIEYLTLSGADNINGYGNGLNNTMSGNSGNNQLWGMSGNDSLFGWAGNDRLYGGVGNDTLYGGAGDDFYYVENVGDVISEAVNMGNAADAGGTDSVTSVVTFVLPNYVERLTLSGSTAINGTGNGLANMIWGNTGNNILNGGAGADSMIGGEGNDTYIVDNSGDRVEEVNNAQNGGTDTVQSSVTHTLGNFVEHLTLTTTAAINGTGNTLANRIIGNAGVNILNGGGGNDNLNGGAGNDVLNGGVGNDILNGGLGVDRLTGGGGVDMFVFSTALNASTNADIITDYDVGGVSDKIGLDDDIFTALGQTGTNAGVALRAGNFFAGTAAQNAGHRIIYNRSTGALFYDRDGTGAAAQVKIATLGTSSHPTLTAADFYVLA